VLSRPRESAKGFRQEATAAKYSGTWADLEDMPCSSHATWNHGAAARRVKEDVNPAISDKQRRPIPATPARSTVAPTLTQKIVGGLILVAALVAFVKLLLSAFGPFLVVAGLALLCIHFFKAG
jgi:hypothetical protein